MSPGSSLALLYIVIAAFAGLSAHVIAQQVFHVPYPGYDDLPQQMQLLQIVRFFAFYAISVILALSLRERSRPAKLGIVFFCSAAFYEQLLRVPVMEGIVTNAWAYAFLPQFALYLKVFLFSVIVVLTAEFAEQSRDSVRRIGILVIGCAVVAAFLIAFEKVGPGFELYLRQLARPPRPDDVALPQDYGFAILVPAYLTYIVPTFAMYLYFRAFSQVISMGAIAVTLLYMTMLSLARGTLLIALISIGPHFLSVFQFSAEVLIATGLIAFFFRDRQDGRTKSHG
ncbi:hypothetical protein [Martelella sp. HB161492]|uniref:hypothetical protein n=1 Tax=Martelella sp. HB161492 TaxID=2720726 RepID=UPI0015922AB4|nr:hypothetical protein [Martelella sp. HB161492]